MNYLTALQKLETEFRFMMGEGIDNGELYYETFWAILNTEGIDFEIGSEDGRMADSDDRSCIPCSGVSTTARR